MSVTCDRWRMTMETTKTCITNQATIHQYAGAAGNIGKKNRRLGPASRRCGGCEQGLRRYRETCRERGYKAAGPSGEGAPTVS